jgi:hypothetical protein
MKLLWEHLIAKYNYTALWVLYFVIRKKLLWISELWNTILPSTLIIQCNYFKRRKVSWDIKLQKVTVVSKNRGCNMDIAFEIHYVPSTWEYEVITIFWFMPGFSFFECVCVTHYLLFKTVNPEFSKLEGNASTNLPREASLTGHAAAVSLV